jgi:glycosyltransferase involved in cell wall biosynthesis
VSLRLLLVHSHGTDVSFGGAERYVAQLAEEMPARGFEVRVLSAFPGSSVVPAEHLRVLHRSDWRVHPARRLRNHAGDLVSRPSAALADALAWARPDVVHTNNLVGITTAVWEHCRREGIPVVHTLHDYYLLCPRVTLLRPDGDLCRPSPFLCGIRTRRLARFGRGVSQVVGVSRFILDRHAHLFPSATLDVVRHPLEERNVRKPGGPGSRLETLGYLGSLERTKGVDRLLEAAPALTRAGLTIRIAGRGRLQPAVEAAAAKLPALHFAGGVGDGAKEAFLAGCDAGILPSVWYEPGGPPYTLVEWLDAGRPVLCSTRGGLDEVIEELDGIVALEPTAAGIEAAVRGLADPGAWEEAVRAVRPPAVRGRTLSDWLDEHERFYRRLAGRAR